MIQDATRVLTEARIEESLSKESGGGSREVRSYDTSVEPPVKEDRSNTRYSRKALFEAGPLVLL